MYSYRAVISLHKLYDQALYPSVVLLLAHCSFAKPDPCKARPMYKCKSLVSQDYSYWVVFVDKDVTAEISAQSQLLHFALHVCAP